MHIESIEFRAFRGQSATHALTPATIIYGRNGSGKTTILQAIQLAILGHVPGRAKTNREPYANATVSLRLSDGEHITRSYTSNGGPVKEKLDTSLMDFDLESLSTPTLDNSEYFNLGPTDAVQYIFERMDLPATHNADGIVSELLAAEFPDHQSEHVTAARESLVLMVREALATGIAEGLAELTGGKGARSVSAVLAYWKKRVQDTQGNLRIAAELQARAGECSAGTLAELRTQIAANGAELAEAQRAAGGLTQRKMAANKVVLRRKELEQALAVEVVPYDDEIAKLRQDIRTLEENRNVVTDLKPMAEYQKDYERALRAISDAQAQANIARMNMEDAERAEIGFAELTECPTCRSKAKGWKKHVSADLAEKASSARLANTLAQEAADLANTNYAEANKALAEVKELLAHNSTTETAIASKQRQIERFDFAQKSAAQQRQQNETELARLVDQDAPTPEQLAEVSGRVQEIEKTARALAAKLDGATRLQHEITQAAQGEQEHAKAKAFVTVFDDAKKKLKARQISTIEALFQGLIAKANYFTAGILDEPLVFREGEIGRIMGDRFVSASDVAGFSDAERGITYVAVAAALAADSPFKVAFLDEVKIDPSNTAKIMARLRQAIEEGVINQAILTHTEPLASEGWSVIQLGEGVAA